ncbi:MAG: V-type ATPase subunit [Candidatus Hydrogenedentes bacterium]|nr:V-type ATPase subunit [Candidatus Hydrogenedentota bacterium]
MRALTKEQHRWGFVCGQISVLEGKLMPYDFFVTLGGIEKTEDVLHRLQETSLREFMVPGAESWEDWSTIIDSYVHSQIEQLKRSCPSTEITDVFLLSEDYVNLKRALLGKGNIFPQNLFNENRLSEIASGNVALYPEVIRPALGVLANPAGPHTENPLIIDIVLDGVYLRHYLWLIGKLGAPLLTEWAQFRVLSKLVVILWRALRMEQNLKLFSQYLLPIEPFNHIVIELCNSNDVRNWISVIPGEVGDVFRESLEFDLDEQIPKFEQKTSNLLTKKVQGAKLQTMGPERVGAFCWGINVEAFNLKLIVSGKLNGLPSSMIRDRIRETYV